MLTETLQDIKSLTTFPTVPAEIGFLSMLCWAEREDRVTPRQPAGSKGNNTHCSQAPHPATAHDPPRYHTGSKTGAEMQGKEGNKHTQNGAHPPRIGLLKTSYAHALHMREKEMREASGKSTRWRQNHFLKKTFA